MTHAFDIKRGGETSVFFCRKTIPVLTACLFVLLVLYVLIESDLRGFRGATLLLSSAAIVLP